MNPLLGCVPLTHCCTVSRTGKELHTLEIARCLVATPHRVNRTASAIVALFATSPSTTLPVVPATNGCTPRVFHSPFGLPVWSTRYVFCPPAYITVYGAFAGRSASEV